MAETTVNGHTVSYIEMGNGPLVLFAHCSLAHAGLWRPVMEHLADDYRCVAIDMPGHGRSDRGDEDDSVQGEGVDYVIGVARALGGPAHMVGLSLGGAVMGRVAIEAPDITRSLAMFEPIFFYLLADRDPEAAADNLTIMEPVFRACREGRYHDAASAFMEGWGQPGQFERFPQAARDAVARAIAYLFPDIDPIDGRTLDHIPADRIATITAPVLLAHGSRTRASAKSINAEVHRLLPHAELAEVPDAGHLSAVDQPRAVADMLRTFWQGL